MSTCRRPGPFVLSPFYYLLVSNTALALEPQALRPDRLPPGPAGPIMVPPESHRSRHRNPDSAAVQDRYGHGGIPVAVKVKFGRKVGRRDDPCGHYASSQRRHQHDAGKSYTRLAGAGAFRPDLWELHGQNEILRFVVFSCTIINHDS